MKKVHLIIIDPQNDFCTANEFNGREAEFGLSPSDFAKVKAKGRQAALCVTGADQDMVRLAKFIVGNTNQISDISTTLDSHQQIHIAHPLFWVNSKGENPSPFTVISSKDVRNGTWRAFHPALQAHALAYTTGLETKGRNALCVWPPHCLIGTWGHSVVPCVSDALQKWEIASTNRVNYVTKGSNFLTEHYSAVMADVPDDNDITTKLNGELIKVLKEADVIPITGEALSHCVKWTITDIANNFGDENIKKFVLLEDTCSNVPGFEKDGQQFVHEMVKRGMRVATTTSF